MIEWATTNGQAARQRSVRQETTIFKAGTLPLNMYRASDFPKEKVSFSLNTVEEQPVTSATTETPSTSHEAIEESHKWRPFYEAQKGVEIFVELYTSTHAIHAFQLVYKLTQPHSSLCLLRGRVSIMQ